MATDTIIHGKYIGDRDEFLRKVEELHARDQISFMATRVAGIGDVLAALPALKALRECWDSVSGTLIVDQSMNLKTLLGDQYFDLLEIQRRTGIRGLVQQRRSIRNSPHHQPDLYLDLNHTQRSYYYCWFAEAKLSIGFKWRGFHRLFFDAALDRAHTKFEGDVLLDPLRLLGIDAEVEYDFSPPDAAAESFENWYRKSSLSSSGQWLVLNPGASVEQKRWAESHWARLIGELVDKGWEGQFVLVEGPSEPGIGDRISRQVNKPGVSESQLVVHRNRPLEEVAHLIDQSRGIITNDTAFYHMGIALGRPTFCIFNNADPFRYRWQTDSVECSYDLRTGEPSLGQVQPKIFDWLDRVGIHQAS